jgi:hypothetical protein
MPCGLGHLIGRFCLMQLIKATIYVQYVPPISLLLSIEVTMVSLASNRRDSVSF